MTFHDNTQRDVCRVIPGTLHPRLDYYASLVDCADLKETSFTNPASQDVWCGLPLENLTRQLSRVTLSGDVKKLLLGHDVSFPEWELLWALLLTEEFIVEGILRDMVDQPHYLAHDIYRFIWAIRFLLKEGDEPRGIILAETLFRWVTGSELTADDIEHLSQQGIQRRIESDAERTDAMCLVVSLAEHNAIIHEVLLCLDGLDGVLTRDQRPALRQLHTIMTGLGRWVHNASCPVGLLIGMDTSKKHMANLKTLHPKLHTEIERYLTWAQ